MASRHVLLTVASAVTVLSFGAGSYLASRSSRLEATNAAAASVAPAPNTTAAVIPATGSAAARPTRAEPASRIARLERPATPRPETTTAIEPRVSSDRIAPTGTDKTLPAPTPIAPPASDSQVASAATAPAPAAAPPVAEPPASKHQEITIKEESVIGLRLDQTVSTATSRVDDRVTARITRDVTVDGRTALPAGTRLEGVVSMVELPGKLRTPSRIGIRFTTLILGENLRVPIRTEAIYRNGEASVGMTSANPMRRPVSPINPPRVGGGVTPPPIAGLPLGTVSGTTAVKVSEREHAVFPGGTPLTLRLSAEIRIQIERDPYDSSRR